MMNRFGNICRIGLTNGYFVKKQMSCWFAHRKTITFLKSTTILEGKNIESRLGNKFRDKPQQTKPAFRKQQECVPVLQGELRDLMIGYGVDGV